MLYSVSPRLVSVAFFLRLILVACFPGPGTRCIFSRAWYEVHIFPRLVRGAYFPALGTRCIFSRAWYQVHIYFPALGTIVCFPALGTNTCFPVLKIGDTFLAISTRCMFFCARHQLHISSFLEQVAHFLRLAPVEYFSVFSSSDFSNVLFHLSRVTTYNI